MSLKRGTRRGGRVREEGERYRWRVRNTLRINADLKDARSCACSDGGERGGIRGRGCVQLSTFRAWTVRWHLRCCRGLLMLPRCMPRELLSMPASNLATLLLLLQWGQ
jgi:hypothetical protein